MDGAAAGLGLVFLLGLRHGLDPDHVAVIDNLTFEASSRRPRWAPWTGFLFSLGHSAAVAIVAVGVGLASGAWRQPAWVSEAVEWAAIALLALVGVSNFRALLRPGPFVPRGWRQWLLPSKLRQVSHPVAILAVGLVFGFVFDTASQAAAWGAAAAASDGIRSAAAVSAAFAAGMILTDTVDSQVVARLVCGPGGRAGLGAYRRAVGCLIVALSFGMAAYGSATKLGLMAEAPDLLLLGLGLGTATGVIVLLAATRRRAGAARAPEPQIS